MWNRIVEDKLLSDADDTARDSSARVPVQPTRRIAAQAQVVLERVEHNCATDYAERAVQPTHRVG